MLSQVEATIYLANQRGCSQQEWHCSYHTFNFGAYFNESRRSFANLQVLNDDTLKEESTVTFQVKENTLILLLPIVGTLNFQNQNEQGSVEVGQCHLFFASNDSEFFISNPYQNELINFLHVWLSVETHEQPYNALRCEFDLELNKNQLLPFAKVESAPFDALAFIGKFDGRREGTLKLKNPNKGAFVFVIEGAFEVQNRLLQPRDGLALRNTSEIEFEALSNEAILLIVEN